LNPVAIQTEVAYQSRALEWGQTLCGHRPRRWLLLDTHEAAAYEDKLAAQVRVLDEALASLEDLHERFVSDLVKETERLRIGHGLSDPDLGPLISTEQLERVLGYLVLDKRERAAVVTGGSRAEAGELRRGLFVRPMLFDAVQSSMRIAQEEIFGPVLTVLTFRDPEEALKLANASPYGLVAGIWTRDIDKTHGLAARIKAGQIYINNYVGDGVATPSAATRRAASGAKKAWRPSRTARR
jgi:acyl-CoA reductase-like NAD-dependent aldehyde dehydrogenase